MTNRRTDVFSYSPSHPELVVEMGVVDTTRSRDMRLRSGQATYQGGTTGVGRVRPVRSHELPDERPMAIESSKVTVDNNRSRSNTGSSLRHVS